VNPATERLNWRADGPDDGAALILVHGLCESLRVWDLVTPSLSSAHRVVRVDLLGFGDSPPARHGYEIEEQARALVATLAEIGRLRGAVLVGHSAGGSVIAAAAAQDPGLARALVLVNSPPTEESRRLSRAERALRTMVVGEAAWTSMRDKDRRAALASAFAPGFAVPAVFVEALARTSHAAFSGTSFGLDRFLQERPLDERVRELGLPTTVIFGMEDQRVDPSAIEPFDSLPGVRVERLERVGHSPMWEAPERTIELIGEAAG
jgi:pimeloyl-ACP methyl ester carboxylesterase